MSATTDQLLDIAGLAERLGVGERFVRRLVKERRIPFLKIGRHVRFDVGEVEAWIRDSRVDAVAAVRRDVARVDRGVTVGRSADG